MRQNKGGFLLLDNYTDRIQVCSYFWPTTRTEYRWVATSGQLHGQNIGGFLLLDNNSDRKLVGSYFWTTTWTEYRWVPTSGQLHETE